VMLTIGDKEVENHTVAVRTLDGQVKFGVKTDELLEKIKHNIKEKELKFVL
jgi:threonyl-tRNA synthetase